MIKFTIIKIGLLALIQFCAPNIFAQDQLRKDVFKIIQSVEADVGVAIKHLEDGDTLTFNGMNPFPMQSVFKFHLGLAVLDQVDKGKISLEQKIPIHKKEFIPKTHSPIADKYPEGNVALSVKELLSYTISNSDNNGCDILLRLVGGPRKVEEYIHRQNVKGIAIVHNEEEMQKSWEAQFDNWTNPWSMIQLLELFYQNRILSKLSRDVLMEMMINTTTGPKRIKGLLPEGTAVAHRTGTGSLNDKGILGALNNVGIVMLPNGKHVAIAIFISKTPESVDRLEEVIAKISKVVFDHYLIKE